MCIRDRVEMCRREAVLLFIGSCHHYAVKLQVAHCLRALRLAEQAAQQRVAYRSIGVLAYAATCVDCLHISVVIVVYVTLLLPNGRFCVRPHDRGFYGLLAISLFREISYFQTTPSFLPFQVLLSYHFLI